MNIGRHVRSGTAEPLEDPFAKRRAPADGKPAPSQPVEGEADATAEPTTPQPTSPVGA